MPASHFDVNSMTGRPKFIVRHSTIFFVTNNSNIFKNIIKKVKNLTLVSFFTIGLVAPFALIIRLLKFKASLASSTITQHIEQILCLHLKNNNNYFQGPLVTLTFLNCILICFIIKLLIYCVVEN
jgi:hypothetical protein